MTDLSTKRERDRLKFREDQPYTQRLCEGGYLTFRRGPDTWGARFRDRQGKQHHFPLKHVGANDYDGAKAAAETWIAQLTNSAVRTVKRSTVRAALEAYLEDLKRHGRPDAAKDALRRFRLLVWDDPLAALSLEAATRDDFEEWRSRQLDRTRKPRTLNRHVRSVAAALNRALELGYVGNSAAWTLKALVDGIEEGGETAVFLAVSHRRALAAAAEPNLATFLRGLELTGARPQELAQAVVGDLGLETIRLAHKKGRPPKLRPRHTLLTVEGFAFFKAQAANKSIGDPLFTEDGVQAWRPHMWARRIRAAITAHNEKVEQERSAKGLEVTNAPELIPTEASAYSFRHARISELLQLYGVDPLTVAAQTGTSLAMIEKAYLKFIPSAFREKLAAIKVS